MGRSSIQVTLGHIVHTREGTEPWRTGTVGTLLTPRVSTFLLLLPLHQDKRYLQSAMVHHSHLAYILTDQMHCFSAFLLGLLLPMMLSSHPQVKPLQVTNPHNDTTYSLNQHQAVYKMVRNVAGSMDEQGNYICVVYLTNSPISLKQIEKLQNSSEELVEKYELKLSKEDEYIQALGAQKKPVLEHMQPLEGSQKGSGSESGSGHTTYSSTDHWEALRWELLGSERLLNQLKAQGRVMGGKGSSTDWILQRVQGQIQNASIILRHLANSQKDNLRTTVQEVSALEGQLNDCERYWSPGHQVQNLPPGSCAHGTLLSISHPLVVQLNWRGFHYKAGAWGRDTGLNLTSSLYWVAPLRSDGRYFDYYWLYKSYDDLVLFQDYIEWKMGYGDGSGNTVYKNFMYFNYYGTGDMAKVHLATNTLVLRQPLLGATYNNRFSYVGVPWKDLDFAGDEKGLWVVYSTEENKGNLVVSRLNASTLAVEKTWHTGQYRPVISGTFMACGVLYALRSLSTRQEEIFYAFDTNTGQELHLSILLDKMLETLQSINYSPLDHKLYVYNDGYLVTYDLVFQQFRLPPSAIDAKVGPKGIKGIKA
ncbi:olfactomedin-4-like [Trichosurus vulpecula]|uniref:olfactomedin-4-like n=1 Tax=Trichosurus vulpecula TaxID=9337 RepID=UPI00186B1C4C|nr:olfactomedin-4-like [Trichosurus vulpecula]